MYEEEITSRDYGPRYIVQYVYYHFIFYFRAPEPSGNVLLLLLILFKYFNYTPAEKDVFDKLFTEAPEKLEAVKRVRNEERK